VGLREYPEELVPAGETPASHLRSLTHAGMARRWPGGVPTKVRAQVEHELALIAELGYEPYFLTVEDIVRYARTQGILCQGQGSAANSAVCYCLGITEVDPARIEILFERFISKERHEPPDIDVDFEHERREAVIQYLYGKYGREMKAKSRSGPPCDGDYRATAGRVESAMQSANAAAQNKTRTIISGQGTASNTTDHGSFCSFKT
jgi:DNA polymerase III alpha subunit